MIKLAVILVSIVYIVVLAIVSHYAIEVFFGKKGKK